MSAASDSRPVVRRKYVGLVISDKMEKTISVSVERLVLHPIFKKYLKRSTVLKAHDAEETAGIGDRVEVMECRPLSKSKRFRLVRVLARAPGTGGAAKGAVS